MSNNLILLQAVLQVMRDARRSQPDLERLVHKRLKKVLVNAYLHVPYYHELMQDMDYDPRHDYRGPGDLSRWPITTNKDVKERGTAAFVKEGTDLSRCSWSATSGTTGAPLALYCSPRESAVRYAKVLRMFLINGYSVGDTLMHITNLTKPPRSSIIQRLGIFRRIGASPRLSPERMVDLFLDYQPDVLWGARTLLDLMALELMRRGIQPKPLKLVIGGAEVIGASSRRLCQEVFGTEMREIYGATETGLIAYETPAHDGLHLCEDLVYFEFLDEHGESVPPGKPGRVVLTDLMGDVMPFIRYDLRDWAVFEQDSFESNGRRRITRIVGRDSDAVQLPDGTWRSFHSFTDIMRDYDQIVQFRVVQKTRALFHILVVADPSYLLRVEEEMRQQLQAGFPNTVDIEIIPVDRLEPDPSGKLRLLVSEVKTIDREDEGS